MSFYISMPLLICIVLSILTIIAVFKNLSSDGDDYGIGYLFAFLICSFFVPFYFAILFAGAYFKWWNL